MLRPKSIRIVSGILLIYFFCITNSYAQNKEIQKTEEYNNSSYVTMNLLAPLIAISPRWRFGYIKNINERWKIGIDLGYGNSSLTFYNNIGDNYELWEIRPEIYYFLKSRKTHNYFSIEPFYINHKDVFMDSHYFPEYGESTRFDQSNYRRQKYGVNFKYGFLFNTKRKIGFNFYTGLGLRIRKNTFSEIINPRIVDLGPEGGDFFGINGHKHIEGSNFGLNLVLGIKLNLGLKN